MSFPSCYRLAVCGMLAGALAAGGCDRKGAADPHFLGHLSVWSGSDRERGQDAIRGVKMAVDELNADQSQWVGGRKVAVLHADTRGEPASFGAQAVRLVSINHVEALLGGLTRKETDEAAPATRDHPVVLVGASGHTGTPPAEAAFAVGLTSAERAKALGNHVIEKYKSKALRIVVDGRSPLGVIVGDLISADVRAAGLTPEVQTFHDEKARDGMNADVAVVVVCAPLAEARALARRWTDAGEVPETLVFGGEEFGAEELAAVNPAVPVVWSAAYTPKADVEAVKKFVGDFRGKFSTEPRADALASYDAARLLFSGARAVRTFARGKLAPQLAGTAEFAGLNGKLAVGTDQVAHGPAYVVRSQNGVVEVTRHTDPPAKQ